VPFDFPYAGTGDWKVANTRRQESQRYHQMGQPVRAGWPAGALRKTRLAITGEAFGGWRLAIANRMAFFGHAPILAHPRQGCYFPTTIPVIFYVPGTLRVFIGIFWLDAL
jgi:hypothetical protein